MKYLRQCRGLWSRWSGEYNVSELSEGKTKREAQIQTDERQARRCDPYPGC